MPQQQYPQVQKQAGAAGAKAKPTPSKNQVELNENRSIDFKDLGGNLGFSDEEEEEYNKLDFVRPEPQADDGSQGTQFETVAGH